MNVLQQKFKLPPRTRRRILCERRKAVYNRQLLHDRTYPHNIPEETQPLLTRIWQKLKVALSCIFRRA